ncbi:MAG: Zn-dependent exopeptidase M28 [Ruminococcaceae bacterium]|nr:Zn-dependent exopeptidase M28 [Oscillospiraceae bacterium]
MITKPIDVLAQHPVRRSKKQKQALRDEVVTYVKGLDYPVTVEQGGRGTANLVIGNPDTAKYLITAHYDTPASIGIPNILTPCNPVIFILWQVLLVGILLAVSIAAMLAVNTLTGDSSYGLLTWYAVYFGILFLMLFGPANKHNANDNTSGVVTLLEIAAAWPRDKRESVCFVLFDLEESGMVGSAAYRKTHKSATQNQIVLNMDCVGDGNEIMMVPMRKLKKDPEKMDILRGLCGQRGEKTIFLHEKGFVTYPSDQRNFPYGVGIAAFKRKKSVGLYVDRIHTARDTILDIENVNYLRDTLLKLAE